MSGSFPAKWPGKCEDCGHWWGQGDLIAYDKNVLMHEDCARGVVGLRAADIELRKDETVCLECHLVHRGECP
ncbi:hypothetical protein SEA_MOOSEHEAD_50 [Gordonia phage Moosehead]|nr:hypothetical protein SEA_MOOSEHEAD_50 [Gordonia phage Moosehead]